MHRGTALNNGVNIGDASSHRTAVSVADSTEWNSRNVSTFAVVSQVSVGSKRLRWMVFRWLLFSDTRSSCFDVEKCLLSRQLSCEPSFGAPRSRIHSLESCIDPEVEGFTLTKRMDNGIGSDSRPELDYPTVVPTCAPCDEKL
ncbi:hypothetical protein AVEN_105023-1 [Araneus ventricosus]|uniref:Uncharacterized protein n=1 Tax=Araneus ventricosus TaxID=182803 RepID=A0A4Y2GFP0_ARAVE|nr:hypothetical protein AVEN_105023-1 [Araneus ventricosus]